MRQTNAFNGYVGLGFRKLSDIENGRYCTNKSVAEPVTRPPFAIVPKDYDSDFHMRVITSGCYYMNISTGNWSFDGLDILKSSGIKNSICSSTHLTVILMIAKYFLIKLRT